MAYKVLARKWRPQQFSEVVGQEHVTRTLENAIRSDRVAHAYLFTGSRGIGKTTSARILAKALNCKKGPTPQPCDQCDSCSQIMTGRSLDVIEIDGASNNGVEQVRELRDNARYVPSHSLYKIYIIDEVHMLSTAAFNALLKTLEEPPSHVKFIFATTDIHKVPSTILSRCQRFDLRRISVPDIVGCLRKGCKDEGVTISENALLAIARGAEGGLRDAASALDQIISFRGKQIDEEDVLAVFGLISRQILEKLTVAVLQPDVPALINLVYEMDRAGKDFQRVVVELLESFRDILVVSYAGEQGGEVLELPEEWLQFYKNQTSGIEEGRILRIIDALVETDLRMRHTLSRKTLLETGLIRCSRAAETASINELLTQVADLKKYVESAAAESSEATEILSSSPAGSKKKNGINEAHILLENWRDIIEQVSRADSLSKAYLTRTVPLRVDENRLIVGYDSDLLDEQNRLEDERTRRALSQAAETYLGRLPAIFYEPLKGGDTRLLPDNISVAVSSGADSRQSPAEREKKWDTNPAVKSAMDAFNGKIINVRE